MRIPGEQFPSFQSSLISCLLGELPNKSGHITIDGRIAYASQEPWVFSGSVRQNILFGKLYDETRYCRTIEVCGLEHDLDSWEHGDLMHVGEKGLKLSGKPRSKSKSNFATVDGHGHFRRPES